MTVEHLGRTTDDLDAGLAEAFLHLGQREDPIDFHVQFGDHVFRCGRRRHHAEPDRHLIAGYAGFIDRRHLGQAGRAFRGGDGQRTQAPGLHMLDHVGHVVEHRLHLIADQVGDRWRAALVRDMGEVGARHHLEQLHRQMVRGAVAGGGVGDLAGLGAGGCQQVLDRFVGRGRVDHQQVGGRAYPGERREVAGDVDFRLRVQAVDKRERKCHHQDGMAVGRRFADEVGADHGAGAGLVIDLRAGREALAELLRQGAAQGVVEGARGERHDDLDRLRREALGLRWCRGCQGQHGDRQDTVAVDFH